MKSPAPPRLPLALLHRFVHDDALAGDILERFASKRSRLWFWRQVLLAIAIGWTRPRDARRPLGLSNGSAFPDVEPSRELPRSVNLSASPLPFVGGLGLVALGVLVSIVRPEAWWFFVPAVAGGVMLGVVMVLARRRGLQVAPGEPLKTKER